MARSTEEIKDSMTTEFISNETIIDKYDLDTNKNFEQQFSKVSLENILFDLMSFVIVYLEKLFDLFRKEVDADIAKSRVHTQKWYREKALAFMYGYTLNESDIYDVEGLNDDQIKKAKIIANAAAQKETTGGRGILRLKVVKLKGDQLVPLDAKELSAFTSYMNLVGDAGTYVLPTTDIGDDLKLELDLHYDPLILDSTGARLDGTNNEPVTTAITQYLKSIEFNGEFIKSELSDVIRRVEGIKYVNIKGAWTKYANYSYTTTNINNAGIVDEIRRPDAGYLILDIEETKYKYIARE